LPAGRGGDEASDPANRAVVVTFTTAG